MYDLVLNWKLVGCCSILSCTTVNQEMIATICLPKFRNCKRFPSTLSMINHCWSFSRFWDNLNFENRTKIKEITAILDKKDLIILIIDVLIIDDYWWIKTSLFTQLFWRLFLGFNLEYASHYLLSTMPWGKHMVLPHGIVDNI